MGRAVAVIASALERADPPGGLVVPAMAPGPSRPRCNSTGIDYESTLSTCPRHTIVTPDARLRQRRRQTTA